MRTGNSVLLRLLGVAVFCSLPMLLMSQETSTCAGNLKNAQSLFDKGQVEMVPGMLKECMRSGFKREEQIAAYKLLIQSYLFVDKLAQADSTMLDFLKSYPEYQVSPTDHSSFVFLFNSFKVKPVVKFTVHAGTNLPFLTFINPVTHSSEPVPKKYSSNMLNFFASLETKIAITPKLDANIEFGFSQIKFTSKESFLTIGMINYTETQQRLEIPLTVTYDILTFGKFTPYARAGIGTAFDLSSSAKVSEIPFELSSSETHSGADIARNDSRISFDMFAQAGVGIKYKTPRGFISMEARMNGGFFNQVKRNTTSLTEELNNYYYYIDDDFNINTLNFSLGYTQIFYKPSKRK
ncbi:MAG: outer membrane beta-barrel protein [Bacteroidales bacterium]